MEKENKIALQKLMVGHFIEKVPEDCKKKVVYVLQGNGLWEQRKNKLGTFTTRISQVEVPGLEVNLCEGWGLNVPKIPISLLGTTIAFFRKVYSMYSSEAFVQFFYDTKKEEYLLHCPKQRVSAGSVNFERDEAFETADKILVFEIHSHGNMSAFFSGTDDKDEKEDRFYGVVGNINKFFPEMKLRLTLGGRHIEEDVEDLFDLEEEMYHAESFPNDWTGRVEKKVITKKGKKGKKEGGIVVYSKGEKQLPLGGFNEGAEDAFGNSFDYATPSNGHSRWCSCPACAKADDVFDYTKQFDNNHLYSSNDIYKDDEESIEEDMDGKFWLVKKTDRCETRTEISEKEYWKRCGFPEAEVDELLTKENVRADNILDDVEKYLNSSDRFSGFPGEAGNMPDWRKSKF